MFNETLKRVPTANRNNRKRKKATIEDKIQNTKEDTKINVELEMQLKILKRETALLKSIPFKQKKDEGIFFTPQKTSELAAEKLNYRTGDGSVLDPACGTGNLLIEVANKLQAKNCLTETLQNWNEIIFGLDINRKFINITKIKIIALAISKGSKPANDLNLKKCMSLLSNIKKGDFTKEYEKYSGSIKNIIMNPPFCSINTPDHIKWTTGKSNAAATFTYLASKIIPTNGKIVGVLPDVLRSGSRYNAWRKELNSLLEYEIEPVGNFEKGVQVDVFILTGNGIEKKPFLPEEIKNTFSGPKLSDYFDISVGPVVPHRDKLEGIESPFAHAKILPPWMVINSINERIAHAGRKTTTPFIAIRRTSSPKDKHRIVASIINCEEPVAVENHIIILSPKSKNLETCLKYIDVLKSEAVDTYINEKIRCRHLTVGIVKSIPLREE